MNKLIKNLKQIRKITTEIKGIIKDIIYIIIFIYLLFNQFF